MTNDELTLYSADNVCRVSAGVDWLTMTLRRDMAAAEQWYGAAMDRILAMMQGGDDVQESYLLGYRGLRSGGSFVGDRDADYIAQFSGARADMAYRALHRPDGHYSRLDFQATLTFTTTPPSLAERSYDMAIDANRNLPSGRTRQVSLYRTHGSGATTYIGSSRSRERGLIYDKGQESRDPLYSDSWRFECRFRNDAATARANSLSARGTTHSRYIMACVADWFSRRGVDTSYWPVDTIEVERTPNLRPTDVQSRLLWLERVGRPVLRKLIDAGWEQQAMAALGVIVDELEPYDTEAIVIAEE